MKLTKRLPKRIKLEPKRATDKRVEDAFHAGLDIGGALARPVEPWAPDEIEAYYLRTNA